MRDARGWRERVKCRVSQPGDNEICWQECRLPKPGSEHDMDASVILIDNYDSFTFNLVHYLGELCADVVVHRNDKIGAADVIAATPDAIVLSPGPCTPNEAGICLELIAAAAATIPVF